MHHKPKKSLGQNFLTDPNIIRKIIAVCDFKATDQVIEIGPGRGAMTALIAARVKRLFAVEIDKELAGSLKEELSDYKNTVVINKDILKSDLREFGIRDLKIFGNIPYYITTAIIEHVLGLKDIVKVAFFTVQKEFGQRIIAKPGTKDYSPLSIFVQFYAQPRIEFFIKRGSFYPSPKVDSCFLTLEILSHPYVKVRDEKLFFRIVRLSFQQRRKTLPNSLQGIIDKQSIQEFFINCGIDPKIRPEDLSLQQFAKLSDFVSSSKD